MPAFRDISVKYKITAISLLTSYVVLVLASVVFVGVEWMSDRRAIGQELETIADIIGNNSTAAIAFDDRDGAEEILAALHAKPNIEWAYIYRADGTVLARYVADALKGRSSASEYDKERIDGDPASLESDGTRANNLVFSYRSIDLYRPIHLNGKAIGAIFIRSNLEQVYASIVTYIRVAVLVILVSCVLAFLLVSQLHKVVTQPILHLLDTMRAVSTSQNFLVRAKKQGADELGALIDGFNQMLAQIQTHNESLRTARQQAQTADRMKSEFLANMSHELRTPLNAIIGFSEIIKDETFGPVGSVQYRDYAGDINESGHHLLALINDILDLS
ncbi:MAG: HAMP domain-containing protein, partial [Nitrospira sp.]|nr:HAMP domain-containing protein [Nitrospira sp.]